ncbi:MAG: glucokinase [Candidatus Eisenbacteria bacterium]|uniref:Glucokinase n=1 Tax=Eiseniibacteriota bacterium TaxID=2212470 RepID=A0A849SFZ2_UNCEI|nr:glucokinase [Candidatus Eisenbacteria bacterium]
MILAADVGGTKTRVALYPPGGSPREPHREARLASRDYPSLEALVISFLASDAPPSVATFGIAGPVVDGRCEGANLPWVADSRVLSRSFGDAAVSLLNDLEATAHGLDLLTPAELAPLQIGAPHPGPRALIAAGTGLGLATVARVGDRWLPMPSEGGHADLAPHDAEGVELYNWLAQRYDALSDGHVSVERVLSGRGLADIYRFLSETGRGGEPAEFATRALGAEDLAPLVSAAALDGSCERARLAVRWFARFYGAEAGNLALRALATAGVYLGGGIAPRLLTLLQDGAFIEAFNSKGRLRRLVERVPVHVILDDRTAMWGAARVALAGSSKT